MTERDYWDASYRVATAHGGDSLTLAKHAGTNWCAISMSVGDQDADSIELRSKQHAEHLHFMLGQMLGLKP